MVRVILVLGAALAASCGSADDRGKGAAGSAAQEKAEKAELKARAEKYLADGVSGVKPPADGDVRDGRYVRLFVVGTSPVSTVLGVEEGLEIAREKAEEKAKAEYVKWLETKVAVRKSVTDEVLLALEGEGAGGLKDQGKKVERRTKEYEETAAGLVRGLKLVAYEQKGAERKVVCVYRWDAGPAPAAKGVTGSKPASPEIPNKKVVIDDAP